MSYLKSVREGEFLPEEQSTAPVIDSNDKTFTVDIT
jgi:hypothetical protein